MGAYRVRMVGGPYDGRTFIYQNPPRVLCFQRCVNGQWTTYQYIATGTDGRYRWRPTLNVRRTPL